MKTVSINYLKQIVKMSEKEAKTAVNLNGARQSESHDSSAHFAEENASAPKDTFGSDKMHMTEGFDNGPAEEGTLVQTPQTVSATALAQNPNIIQIRGGDRNANIQNQASAETSFENESPIR